jgi:hypothetical protein
MEEVERKLGFGRNSLVISLFVFSFNNRSSMLISNSRPCYCCIECIPYNMHPYQMSAFTEVVHGSFKLKISTSLIGSGL